MHACAQGRCCIEDNQEDAIEHIHASFWIKIAMSWKLAAACAGWFADWVKGQKHKFPCHGRTIGTHLRVDVIACRGSGGMSHLACDTGREKRLSLNQMRRGQPYTRLRPTA